MTLQFKNGRAFCSLCEEYLTIISENGGKGFRARCPTCKVTYYYPACDICGQALWKHDEEKCKSVKAEKIGLRYCRKCKNNKSPEEFNMNGATRSARCKTCQAEYYEAWYARKKRTDEETESISEEELLEELFG